MVVRMWLINCTLRQSTIKTDGYFKITCITMTLVTEYMQFESDEVLH